MFFVLSKILSYLLAPEIWIITLFILGFVYRQYLQRSMIFFSVAFGLFLIYTNKFLAMEVLRCWEEPVTQLTKKDTAFAAGIVLGGGMVVEDTENKRITFQQNVDRIMQAVLLYKKGTIKKIIISSGSGSLIFPDIRESVLLKKYFTDIGIPAQDIIIDSLSDNTYQNAIQSKIITQTHFPTGSKFLLITSSIHMKRAIKCFEKQKIPVKAYTTNKMSGERRYQYDMFIPTIDATYYWKKFLHEWYGYMMYSLMGYI